MIFSALTLGSPLLRAGLVAGLILIGAKAAERLGLRLEGHSAKFPVLIGLAGAIAVARYVVLLDCFLFRHMLDPGYVEFLHQPLAARLLYFMPRAFNENIMYRLFGFAGLAVLLNRASAGKLPSSTVLAVAMIAAQVINIGVNTTALSNESLTPPMLLYDALRYVVPGVLWAVLLCVMGSLLPSLPRSGATYFCNQRFRCSCEWLLSDRQGLAI